MKARHIVWFVALLVGAASVLCFVNPAAAAVIYWNGTNTNSGDWNTAANWSTASNATTPASAATPGSADVAAFSISGLNTAETVNLNLAQSVAGLNFLGANSGTTSLQGGGAGIQNLTVGASGITVASGAGAVTIGSSTANQGVAIQLSGSQNWTNNSANPLTVVNNITNVANTTPYVLTFNGSGAGGTMLDGLISDGGSTGTAALTINTTGGGVTTLFGANTYSGATTLTAGVLQLANTAAISNSALKLNGGTLQLRGDASGTFATASTTIGGNTTIDVNQAGIGSGQTLSLGALGVANGTTLNVTGGNSYTLALGTITVASGGASFSPTTANLATGTINFSGNGNLTMSGSGLWTLNGVVDPKGYPGYFTVNAGTLRLGLSNAIANPSGYGVGLSVNSGVFDLAGYSEEIATLNTASTGGTITNSSSTTANTLTVDDMNQAGPTQTYPGILTDNGGSGKLNLTVMSKSSYGQSTTLTLSSTNSSYTGVTTVLGGRGSTDGVPNNANTLSVASLANGGVNCSLGAATNAASNIVLNWGGVLQYTGSTSSTDRLFSVGGTYGGMIAASGSGPVSFTNTGTIGFNGSTNARYLALVGTNTGANTLAATIANSPGATTLTKAGSGTWLLGNLANSYSGATIVGGGSLNVPLLANGGSNSSIGASTSAASNLVLSGGTLQYTGATAQTTNRLFTISPTGGAIDSSGAGTLSFTNPGANVSSDPVSANYWTQTGMAGNVSLVQSSMLATDLAVGMSVSGGGVAAGTTITSINSSGNGNIALTSAPATWTTDTFSFGYNATVTGARTLTLTGSNTGANTIAGSLANSTSAVLSVNKTGAGQWVLGGVNTYTGSTTVNAGTLNILGSLGAGSAVAVNGGGLLGGTGVINGPVTVAGGSSSATQGAINLVDGSIGTLYLNNTLALAGAAGNPSLLNFEYGSAGFDKVAVAGALTFNAGGGIINLTSLGTNPPLGSYNLLTFPSESGAGAFTFPGGVTTMNIGNEGFTLSNAGTAETLTVSSASATVAHYILGLTAASTHAHTGGTINLTSSITNAGGDSNSDSIDYSGLGATAGSGTLGGPTSGAAGNVVYGVSAYTTGLTYTTSIGGSHTITAAVSSALNHSAGGPATLTSAQSVTVQFYSGQGLWSGASSSNWNDFGNWDNAGGAPGLDPNYPTGDTATLGTTVSGPATVYLNGVNPSITTLTLNSTTSNYTLTQGTSGTLTLNGSGAAINVTGNHGISAPVALGSDTTITTNNSGDSLAVSGAISGNGTSLTVAGPGLVTLAGVNTYTGPTSVQNGTLALVTLSGTTAGSLSATSVVTLGSGSTSGVFQLGDASNPVNQTLAGLATSGSGTRNAVVGSNSAASTLTLAGTASSAYSGLLGGAGTNQNNLALTVNLSGAGSLALLGANTLTGATTLTAGILQLANTAAISSSALMLNGGTLQLRGDTSSTYATASTTIGGSTTIDVNQSAMGTGQTLNLGALSAVNGVTVNVTGGNGYTLGLGAITPIGSQPWVPVTFNPTTVNLSIASINLGGNGNSVNLGGTSTGNVIAGSINCSNAASVTKIGSGTWTLAGVSPAMNGWPEPINVNQGTLKLGTNNPLNSQGGLQLSVNGGAFDLAGYSQTISVLSGASGTITNSSTTPSTLTINAQDTWLSSVFSGTLTDNGAGGGTLGLNLSFQNAYSVTLSGTNNSYMGVTTIQTNAGSYTSVPILSVASLANGGSNSSIGASTNAASNLILDYGGVLQYVGPATSTDRLFSIGKNSGGMIDSSGAGPVSFTNTGTMGFNSASGSRYLALVGNNTGNNTLAATLADNGGPTSVTKAGAGTWLVTNTTSSYSGATIVGGGILNVPALANIGVASPIGAGASTSNSANAASLVLSGGTLQYTGSAAQTTNRLFTIAATGGVIDSSGSGTLSFTNSGANVSSDPAPKTTYNGGATTTEIFDGSNMLATDLVAGMTVSGGGLSGTASITSVNSPTSITLNATGNWGAGTFSFSTVNRTLTLTGSNTGANTIAGSLGNSPSATLALAKTGVGQWVLSGANTYTGGTTVSGGLLQLGNNSALGTGGLTANAGVVDLAGFSPSVASLSGAAGILTNSGGSLATLTVVQNGTTTFSGTLQDGVSPTALLMTGTGALLLTGSNTFSGQVQVNNGSNSGQIVVANPLALENANLTGGNDNDLGFAANITSATLGSIGTTSPATQSLTLSNAASGGVTLAVGNNGSNGTYSGSFLGNGGLSKIGRGALTLAGTSSNSGPNSLNAGTLVLANATGSALGSGGLTLTGGTLAGTTLGGTIGSLVQAQSGATIAPGAGLSAGQYGILNLTGGLNTNATLAFDLGTPVSGGVSTGDLINLGGSALTVLGGSITFAANSLPGDYRLFENVGSIDNLNNFVLPGVNGDAYALSTPGTGYIDLVITCTSEAWNRNTSGSWAASGNWSPTAIPTIGTVMFAGTPTAPLTVTLDGNQSAGALVFDTSSTSGYTLSQGTGGGALTLGTPSAGGSITVVSGTHTISAPLVLAGNLSVVPSASTTLNVSGSIGEASPGGMTLTLDGPGTSVLSGTAANSYTGGTYVDEGTLIVNNSGAIYDGTSLTVGAGGVFIFDPSVIAAPGKTASGGAVSLTMVSAVPEPGTITLLVAALWSAAIYRRFRWPKTFWSAIADHDYGCMEPDMLPDRFSKTAQQRYLRF